MEFYQCLLPPLAPSIHARKDNLGHLCRTHKSIQYTLISNVTGALEFGLVDDCNTVIVGSFACCNNCFWVNTKCYRTNG